MASELKVGDRFRVPATNGVLWREIFPNMEGLKIIDVTVLGNQSEGVLVVAIDKEDQDFVGSWLIDSVDVRDLVDNTPGITLDEAMKHIGKMAYNYRAEWVKPEWIISRSAPHRREPDGMNCNQCKEFVPMACANMGDSFRCFQCRQDPYRMSY